MKRDWFSEFREITPEERAILDNGTGVQKDIYSAQREFIVESGRFIEDIAEPVAVRRHIRFVDFPVHRHDYVEIFHVLTGSVTHIINGEEITVHTGELLLLNEHAEHAIRACEEMDLGINIIIRPVFFEEVLKLMDAENILVGFLKESMEGDSAPGKFLYYKVSASDCIQNLIRNTVWLIVNRPRQWYMLTQHTMSVLFLHLIANAEHLLLDRTDENLNMLMVVVRQYIMDRLDTGTLSELAGQIGYTPSSLSRLIRKYSGSTFKEIQTKQRLRTAMNLLLTTDRPVLEIAGIVGYENLNFFYQKFKTEYGITPGDARSG